MRIVNRVSVLVAALSLFLASGAHAQKKSSFSDIPVTGTVAGGGAFQGTMNVLGFVNDNGLKAIASLTGTLTPANGAAQQIPATLIALPVDPQSATGGFGGAPTAVAAPSAATPATCPILHLDLGPLDLNLLGLAVHLNEVVLDVAAQPGNGNLVGNLLCAVANLLNGPGTVAGLASVTNAVATLLNNLLAAL
jgi:hypothetical protein